MAKQIQLQDNAGNNAYPITSSACVGMSDGGGSLDDKLKSMAIDQELDASSERGIANGVVTEKLSLLFNNIKTIQDYGLGYYNSNGELVENNQFFYVKFKLLEHGVVHTTRMANGGIAFNCLFDENGELYWKLNNPVAYERDCEIYALEGKGISTVVINGRVENIDTFKLIVESYGSLYSSDKNVKTGLGYYNSAGTIVSNGENTLANFCYYKLRVHKGLRVYYYNTVASGDTLLALCLLDSTNALLDATLLYSTANTEQYYDVENDNAVWLVISGRVAERENFYYSFQELKDTSGNEDDIFYGKSINTQGDSIAYGLGNDGKGYGGIIAEQYGMTHIQTAVSGSTIRKITDSGRACIPELAASEKLNWENSDYIILEGGYNDIYFEEYDLPSDEDWLGEFNPTEYAHQDTISEEENKFYDRLDWWLNYIVYNKKASAKVMYVINWKCLNIAFRKTDPNTAAERFASVRQAIYDVCEKYGIPVLDLWAGLPVDANKSPYIEYTRNQDRTHPTDDGYRLFWVNPIVAKMRTL